MCLEVVAYDRAPCDGAEHIDPGICTEAHRARLAFEFCKFTPRVLCVMVCMSRAFDRCVRPHVRPVALASDAFHHVP